MSSQKSRSNVWCVAVDVMGLAHRVQKGGGRREKRD